VAGVPTKSFDLTEGKVLQNKSPASPGCLSTSDTLQLIQLIVEICLDGSIIWRTLLKGVHLMISCSTNEMRTILHSCQIQKYITINLSISFN